MLYKPHFIHSLLLKTFKIIYNMKSLLIGLTLLFISVSSFAQLNEKTWLLGGSGSLYSYSQNYISPLNTLEAKYTNIELSGTVGYFVVKKFAVGLRPGFSFFKGNVTNQGDVSGITKAGIGPFARYYLLDSEKQFNLLADVSYQLGLTKEPIGTKSKGNFNSLTLLVGTEVFFNSSVGLEVLLGYRKTHEILNKPVFEYEDNRTGFLVSVGFQFHLENN